MMFIFKVVDQYNFTYWEGESTIECSKFYKENKDKYKSHGKKLRFTMRGKKNVRDFI